MRLAAALLAAFLGPAHAQGLSDHTENVLHHVIAHEMGHALMREFDLPVFGFEEGLADSFAIVFLHQKLPDQAEEIVASVAKAWQLNDHDASLFSEYEDDERRAAQAICLLYGMDPNRHKQFAIDSGMTPDEARECRDFAPEIERAWRRATAPLYLPEGERVTEVRVIFGDGPMKEAMEGSRAFATMRTHLRRIDWHSQIALHGDSCDGAASWFRSSRKIRICDNLVRRLEAQADELR